MAVTVQETRPFEIEPAERRSARAALLWLIVAVGAVLRVHQLGAESYWIDETTMLRVATLSAVDFMGQVAQGRPPVYPLLLRLWIALVGTSEAAVRALPALIGVASLPLMYLTGRRLFGPTVGLVAAGIMAVAPIQIYHGQENRYYALVMFFALLSFLFMARALETGRRRDWIGYVVATVLLFYTHPYGLFAIAGQDLYVLLARRRHRSQFRPWILAQVVVFAVLAPALWQAYGPVSSGEKDVMNWLPQFPPVVLAITVFNYVMLGPTRPLAVAAALAILAIGALAGWWFSRRRGPVDLVPVVPPWSAVRPGLLTLCWLASPILLPFIASRVLGPMYHIRYTLAAAPALYLLLAWGAASIARVVPPAATLLAYAALVAPNLAGYYANDIKENWRALAARLGSEGRPGDVVVLAPAESGTMAYAFRTYYHGELPVCELDESRLRDPGAVAARVADCAGGARRIWLVLRGPEPMTEPVRHYFFEDPPQRYQPLDRAELSGLDVHLFVAR